MYFGTLKKILLSNFKNFGKKIGKSEEIKMTCIKIMVEISHAKKKTE